MSFDAIAKEGELQGLLSAIISAGVSLDLSPQRTERATAQFGTLLTQNYPQGDVATYLAIVVRVAANQCADLVGQIQDVVPISNPALDGRVRAIVSAFEWQLRRAVHERAMTSRRDKVAAAQIDKMFGRKP